MSALIHSTVFVFYSRSQHLRFSVYRGLAVCHHGSGSACLGWQYQPFPPTGFVSNHHVFTETMLIRLEQILVGGFVLLHAIQCALPWASLAGRSAGSPHLQRLESGHFLPCWESRTQGGDFVSDLCVRGRSRPP